MDKIKMKEEIIKIAIVDDHILFSYAIAQMMSSFDGFRVILLADNGRKFIELLQPDNLPDVVLLDQNMPVMDGFETAEWLQQKYPSIHILMLTTYESDYAIIRLLKYGVKGFLKKEIHPADLNFAIRTVFQTGVYYSQSISVKLANLFRYNNANISILEKLMLSEQEIAFLKLASTDLTYKEIASLMKLNPRAVDAIRGQLFEKLDVKSRVGLAMYSLRQGIVAM